VHFLHKDHTLPRRYAFFALAAIATLAYATSLGIPLIADDYPNISQALTYGAPSGLSTLLSDAQFRLRATSYWAMYGLWHIAGLTPAAYHAASLLLHIANTWMVFLLAVAWPRMRPAAFWAAAFFAMQEGHQEAVMWFSAISELLMFLFGLGALWCWCRAEPLADARGSEGASIEDRSALLWEACGVLLFAGALLSKESAIALLPLFLLVIEPADWRRRLPHLAPHGLLSLGALASIAQSRTNSFRFSDGSFSLHAPFWITWPHSYARLLWVWGWPAALVLLFVVRPAQRRSVLVVALWMGISLAPYSFLTYSTEIPSRQTYLASAGLALLVGLALAQYANRRIAGMVLCVMLVHNTAYLWTKKHRQFVERATPTSQLLEFARRTPGPIRMQCFPLPGIVAEEAVRLGAGRSPGDLIWSASDPRAASAASFCFQDPARVKLLR
jgi:hypothetical protein